MSDLKVFKEEIKEYKRLKIISEMAPIREYIKNLEEKHKCNFDEFQARLKEESENFDKWDEYIEWKAYEKKLEELKNYMKEIENAEDITFVE
ncbi:MAG: hypothetical protein D5R97_07955 [Candidatus Syntrophonatronum acetioxidans]|uniref:Uncharacterized protein n=1 Tax=Candidatus Syntrophonatronum acetioxidans TaxID=1795816 RepID=A0A424YBV4_9FIRM|nr:MAG: hypothetical protein D5R97_07955 [Candidatus Syntrophonatronum acetioxidans]